MTTQTTTFTDLLHRFRLLPDAEHRVVLRQRAERARGAQPHADADELARRVARRTVTRLAQLGGAGGLLAAIPGGGTAMQVAKEASTGGAEMWLTARTLISAQYEIAALYGHDLDDPARVAEVQIVWALASGVAVPVRGLMCSVGERVATAQFNRRVSGASLRRINQRLGTTVLTKWGTKRGGIALGRLIPFGVGVVIGAAVNGMMARAVMNAVLTWYAAEVIVVEA